MMVDRERCPSCGRKALRHRTRTNDYRCKECSKIYPARYFDVEDALLTTLRQLRDALKPVAKSYEAPKRYFQDSSINDTSVLPGCLFVLTWIVAGIAIFVLTAGWEWYLRSGAAAVGGLVLAVVVGTALVPNKKKPPPSEPGRLPETEEYKQWCRENPLLAAFEDGPFKRMLHGVAFFPQHPNHYDKRYYAISADGTKVELYSMADAEFHLPLTITDDHVAEVIKLVEKCSEPANVAILRRIFDTLVPLVRNGDTTVLLEGSASAGKPPSKTTDQSPLPQ